MKMTKHTPGPWKVTDRFEISMDDGDVQSLVATVNADSGSVSGEQAEADARLIAAAPELLAALRNLQFHAEAACQSEVSDMQRDLTRMSAARALAILAKAEG